VGGVSVTAYGENVAGAGHGWSYMLDVGGFRVYDGGCSDWPDFLPLSESYSELLDADVAFLPVWFDRAQYVGRVHPALTVMMHIDSSCEVYLGASDTPTTVPSNTPYEF
jgi:hypothetical protein